MKLSLRNRILLPVLLLVTLGLAVQSGFYFLDARRLLVANMNAQLLQSADSLLAQMQSWVESRRLDVDTWAAQRVFEGPFLEGTNQTAMARAAR